MGEMLKELGKFFYNFALIVGGAGLVQLLFEGKYSLSSLVWGIVSFSLLVVLGSALIVIGEKLKTEEE